MALKYQLDELLKVREKIRDTAEVVRRISNSECGEHILRSSNGFDSRRNRVRTSSVVTNPYEEAIADDPATRDTKPRNRSGKYLRYSPTPSIKRGKAEKLLKEHGSPPGIRVTAGGRIVPDGLSPIPSPNFDVHASSKQEHINRFNQNFTYSKPASATQKLFNGFVVDLGTGPLHQVVDGELRPIEYDNGVLQLYMPAPNLGLLPDPSQMIPYQNAHGYFSFLPQPPTQVWPRSEAISMASGLDIPVSHVHSAKDIRQLEQTHGKLEQELKDLDRNEVLQRGAMTQAKKAEIVRTRISLVNRIDESRRGIEIAKKLSRNGTKSTNPHFYPYGIPITSQLTDISENKSININCEGVGLGFQSNQNGDMGPQSSTAACNEFQPEAPAFVPRRYRNLLQHDYQPLSVLHERAGNAGLGVGLGNKASASAISRTTGCMNLDGSSQHPRRSHAIEIKKPGDDLAAKITQMTPTSQCNSLRGTATDRSQNSDRQGEMLSFMPSPSLVARMDTLLQSPREDNDPFDPYGQNMNQSSESSATTADFFPHDAYEHSANKKSVTKKDIQVNLPAWMPKIGESREIDTRHTPTRPPNKFVFNDESPSDGPISKALSVEEGDAKTVHGRNMIESDTHQRESTGALQLSHRRISDMQLHASGLSDSAENDAIHHSKLCSPGRLKSDAYWEGYEMGVHQNILGINQNEDYRIGYRDGLVQSSFGTDTSPYESFDNAGLQVSSVSSKIPVTHTDHSAKVSSVAKATSFPSLGGTSVSVSAPPVPIPPANSLATTPTKSESAKKDHSPTMELRLDSPIARANFMAQPNVNFNAVRESVAKKNASPSSPVSPLRDRKIVNVASDVDLSNGPSFAKRMRKIGHPYDEQRYQKGSTSVAQTNQNARAQFPSQYDGSAEDEKPSNKGESNVGAPTTPSSKSKSKTKTSGSPVKAKASVAVATMKQVAGIGSKREDTKKDEQISTGKGNKKKREVDASLMSSPEKRRWRENWTKNFSAAQKGGTRGE